jgi:dCTP deaminase
MSLLRDDEIIASITVQAPAVPYVEGVTLPADPYSKDSPVQASSIDLHIGNIYLPGEKESDPGGAQSPRRDYCLKTGETAVVTTLEVLHLPPDVAAFGFPPSSVSFKGLLMTNPGHVDPGYEGVMRFTVINMGKDSYPLERGGRIVTLLIFRMVGAVNRSWSQRNAPLPETPQMPSHANISRLSRDFVNVDERAKDKANEYGVKWTLAITAIATLIVGLVPHVLSRSDIEELKRRQDIVEYDLKNRVDVEQKLKDFDHRLRDLEQTRTAQKPIRAASPSTSKTRTKNQ